MTIVEAINDKIKDVAEYMAMLYTFTGNPVAFEYTANGRTYSLTISEVVAPEESPEETGVESV